MTYREQFEAALACNTVLEANAFMNKEIERYWELYGKSPEEAHKIILSNIGYMAGYYDDKTAEKIHRLFGANHPVFGGPGYHKTVTAEAAFKAGKDLAERGKR